MVSSLHTASTSTSVVARRSFTAHVHSPSAPVDELSAALVASYLSILLRALQPSFHHHVVCHVPPHQTLIAACPHTAPPLTDEVSADNIASHSPRCPSPYQSSVTHSIVAYLCPSCGLRMLSVSRHLTPCSRSSPPLSSCSSSLLSSRLSSSSLSRRTFSTIQDSSWLNGTNASEHHHTPLSPHVQPAVHSPTRHLHTSVSHLTLPPRAAALTC